MHKITINGLSAESLRKAAEEVDKLQVGYVVKNREYVRALTRAGIEEASNHLTFKGDSETPTFGTKNPYVRMWHREGLMTSSIRLTGEDVAFVEFGAGVHYNGHPNSSPNPYGVKLGYTIGSYGWHQGLDDFWSYKDDNGVDVVSYGTEAAMPLFYASEAIKQKYRDIAKSVFGS